MTWQEFEELCVKYLTNTYSLPYKTAFKGTGGSNSRQEDIEVTTQCGSFFIETKKDNAQSGQFVVLPSGDGFYFSPRNTDHNNTYSQQIIDHMNSYGDAFLNPGTSGMKLSLPNSLMTDWVISHYKNKGARFVISSSDYSKFVIFPVEKLADYFEISAKYRVKRSGSSHAGPSHQNEIQSILNAIDPLATIAIINRKTIVISNVLTNKQQLSGSDNSYQFNQLANSNRFEVKKLSNTANPNVIFSIKLIKDQDAADLEKFISAIECSP